MIWEEYHRTQERFAATTLTTLQHQKFMARLTKSPFFALPLQSTKGEGFTVLVSQYNKHEKMLSLTGLDEYNTNPMHACPYIIVHMYTELATLEQNMVLVRSELINPALDKSQVERIWAMLERFYLSDSEHYNVEQFNHDPHSFDTNKFFEKLKRESS